MNKLASYLAGVFSATALLGGLGAWFFLRAPDPGPALAPAPQAASGTSPQTSQPALPFNAPSVTDERVTVIGEKVTSRPLSDQEKKQIAADPSIQLLFSGRVEIPELLEKRIGKEPRGDVRVTVREISGAQPGEVLSTEEYRNVKLPFLFTTRLRRGDLSKFLGKEKLGPFMVVVFFCYGEARSALGCDRGTFPRLGGFVESTISLPGGIKSRTNLMLPPIFVNRLFAATSLEECVKSKRRIAGQVVATPAFSQAQKMNGKLAVVFIPLGMRMIPPPYIGNDTRPITKAELETAVNRYGTSYSIINLQGTNPSPLSLKVNEGYENTVGYYFATPCRPNEQDTDCVARIFPLTSFSINHFADRNLFKLIPKGWKMPTCGELDVTWYLHQFDANQIGTATREAYSKANPPELVEGMSW